MIIFGKLGPCLSQEVEEGLKPQKVLMLCSCQRGVGWGVQ